jgi:hypothetical protein
MTWTAADGATVHGRVATIGGQPIAGVDLFLRGGDDGRGNQFGRFATAGVDGSYAITGVPPGTYQLTTTATAFSGSPVKLSATVEVHGTDTVTHDFAVDAGQLGALAGHLSPTTGQLPTRMLAVLGADTPTNQGISISVDDSGAFSADGLPAGSYHLIVQSDGVPIAVAATPEGAPVRITGGQTTTVDLAVRLGDGAIRGHVIDAHGAPVANAIVLVESTQSASTPHFESELQTTTDAHGAFVMSHLIAPSYHVRAVQREGVDVVRDEVAVGGDITLRLPESSSIVGFAHRSAGALGDLDVAVLERDHTVVRSQTFARSDGHFVLDDLAPGSYTLLVEADGSNAAIEAVVTAAAATQVDVALPELVTIIGRVVDSRTGRGLPGMSVSATGADDGASNQSALDGGAHISDPGGRFEIIGVPRRLVTISARAIDDDSATWVGNVTRDVGGSANVVDVGDVAAVTKAFNNKGDCGCNITSDDRAEVTSIALDGAAATAGIVEGDVITAVDGVDTTGHRAVLARWMLGGDVGSRVTVTLARGVDVTLVRAP